MPEFLVELIQKDPDTFIRVVAFIIALIGARGIYQIIRRNNQDAEIIRRTLERREERVDELEEDEKTHTQLVNELSARLARAEAERDECREQRKQSGSSALSVREELTLRDMIARLKDENRKLQSNRREGDYREE